MANFYEKAITRFEDKLKKPYFRRQMSFINKSLATPYQETSEAINSGLSRRDLPENLRQNYLLKQQQNLLGTQKNIELDVVEQENERRRGLSDSIEELRFKSDLYEEQKKEREDAEKKRREKGTMSNIVRGGMGLLGGGLGFLAGGVPGAMIGSQIGGGVGSAIIGADKTYESPELIMQGLGNISAGLLSTAQYQGQKKFARGFGDNRDAIMNMNSDQLRMFGLEYENALRRGEYDFFDKYQFSQEF